MLIDLAVSMLETSDLLPCNVDLLSFVGPRIQSSNLPSWMPDWIYDKVPQAYVHHWLRSLLVKVHASVLDHMRCLTFFSSFLSITLSMSAGC